MQHTDITAGWGITQPDLSFWLISENSQLSNACSVLLNSSLTISLFFHTFESLSQFLKKLVNSRIFGWNLCPTHCSLHEVSVTFCKVNHTFLHVITIYYPCFDKQTNTALKTPLQPQHKVKSNDFLTLKLLNLTVT